MKTYTLADVTAVTFNYSTGRMTKGAAVNFKKFYPDVPLLIVDDGSQTERAQQVFNASYNRGPENAKGKRDTDLEVLKGIPGTEFIPFEDHMGHGVTIDRTIPLIKTDLMLTMDSDMRIVEPGLIEEYLEKYNEDPENIYAVGTQTTKDFMGKDGPYLYTWCDPWFTLWNMEPLRRYPRVSFAELFTPGRNQFGASCIISMFLEFDELHRPRPPYHCVLFPEPKDQPKLWHLRKEFDEVGTKNAEMWDKLIDG
jgi:glycosyltransferase involved in cell wall biosynthesis